MVNSLFNQSRTWVLRDPLALDLDGDGIETIGINQATHVLFDHDGDGTRLGSGWLKGDDAWLVLDRNGNGRIDNGRELFGTDTVMSDGHKASSGFAALADLESNHDHTFSNADADFSRVMVWRDLDQDGVSDSGELQSLTAAGIVSIGLASTGGTLQLNGGNVQTATAFYNRADGGTGKVANLDLISSAFYRDFGTKISLSAEAFHLPCVRGSGMVRDLREAASLDPKLIQEVDAFKGISRADMMAKLDQLLEDWAGTADFKTSKQQAAEMGATLLFRLPDVTLDEMRAIEVLGQPGYFKSQVLTTLAISEERYAKVLAEVTEMGRIIEVL